MKKRIAAAALSALLIITSLLASCSAGSSKVSPADAAKKLTAGLASWSDSGAVRYTVKLSCKYETTLESDSSETLDYDYTLAEKDQEDGTKAYLSEFVAHLSDTMAAYYGRSELTIKEYFDGHVTYADSLGKCMKTTGEKTDISDSVPLFSGVSAEEKNVTSAVSTAKDGGVTEYSYTLDSDKLYELYLLLDLSEYTNFDISSYWSGLRTLDGAFTASFEGDKMTGMHFFGEFDVESAATDAEGKSSASLLTVEITYTLNSLGSADFSGIPDLSLYADSDIINALASDYLSGSTLPVADYPALYEKYVAQYGKADTDLAAAYLESAYGAKLGALSAVFNRLFAEDGSPVRAYDTEYAAICTEFGEEDTKAAIAALGVSTEYDLGMYAVIAELLTDEDGTKKENPEELIKELYTEYGEERVKNAYSQMFSE